MNASTTPPASFVLPSPVAAFTSRLPAFPGSLLLVTALNLGVARQLPRDVGDMLLNKRLRIHVRDARAQLQPLMPEQSCNGYWHGRPGLDLVESEALAAA